MSSSTAKAAGSSSNVQTATSANLTGARCKPSSVASSGNGPASGQQPSSLSFSSSAAFQQVKQTQASLARLSRVHHHQQQQQQHQYNHNQHLSQTNQSSQQVSSKESNSALSQPTPSKSTTFIDCLIRRFKDCFSEDFCTVPMFVVGNLSPGSDGTHLILPPCVSLGRQNISRFAGPKNLRLMNSIRESCRSIEELDLGGNKLTDLIEVYKILQCTPNLKFLNLSENDLSRSSPVAMAATSCPTSSSSSSPSSSSFSSSSATSTPTSASLAAHHHHQYANLNAAPGQRACLAPINQNYQQAIGSRRHSTLGAASSVQSASPGTAGGRPVSRVAEARRLAAAAAVAQSKKTSSSVASKLADTAASGSASRMLARPSGNSSRIASNGGGRTIGNSAAGDKLAHQRHPTGTTSTMHLARSLSSLSSKDVVRAAASSSIASARLTAAHRAGGRATKEASCIRNYRGPADNRSAVAQQQSAISRAHNNEPELPDNKQQQQQQTTREARLSDAETNKPSTKLSATGKLFVEPPIVETEDVDMSGEQPQLSPSSTGIPANIATTNSANNANQLSTIATSKTLQTINSSGGNINQHPVRPSNIVFSSASSQSSSPNYRRTFESIKALALNNTGCQWRVVCSILSRMPNLEELHLSLNNYERIDLDPNEFKHYSLQRLYLCNNPKLTNWEELDKLLSAFPSLQALSIADCNISQIPENLDRSHEWRKLCGLNINGWPIKEWPVIERLNQLPSLIDLKCRNLDIFSTIDEPRHHLIARLPKLQRLNGSEIEEREHAEKTFLRFFMANSHLERPPRFHELVQIHGEVIPVDVDVDLSPPSQANVRVIFLNKNYYRKENEDDIFMSEDFLTKLMDNVDTPAQNNVVQQDELSEGQTIRSNNSENMELSVYDGSNSSTTNSSQQNRELQRVTTTIGDKEFVRLFKDESQEVVAIDIDLRQSVRKFKSTIASIFDLESQNVILYYIDHEMVGLMGPELIKHNKKKLWNYNVQDGDQFIVEER